MVLLVIHFPIVLHVLKKKTYLGAGEVAQQLQSPTKGQSSVPSTPWVAHSPCTSSTGGGCEAPSWPLQALHACGAPVHTHNNTSFITQKKMF